MKAKKEKQQRGPQRSEVKKDRMKAMRVLSKAKGMSPKTRPIDAAAKYWPDVVDFERSK